MCQACHEDIAKIFAKASRHARLESDTHRGWSGYACEACHGPGAKHAETVDPAFIRQPAKLSAAQADQVCLACHANQSPRAGRVISGHARNTVSCVSCHRVHAETSRPEHAAGVNKLCSGCHTSQRAAFNRPHAHRVNQNAMSCADCHDPHGAFLGKGTALGEPSCLRCHGDKRGPFSYEHAPVRFEGCQGCHEPHGSANPRMLTRPSVSQLCLECHTSTMAAGGIPPAFHDLRSARYRNCTVCHQKIHGSHADRAFLR